MKYILDTNSLNRYLTSGASGRTDLYTIQDVEDEHTSYGAKPSNIRGITVLQKNTKHLRKLQQLLTDEGDNFELIRLYTAEGTADVMILAYILAEHEMPDTLFPDEFTIITRDNGIAAAARKYGIPCRVRI